MSANYTILSFSLDDHDRLDAELGGGLPRGSIILVEGDYGVGKNALSQRFSYGFCETNHTVTYLSTELAVGGFVHRPGSERRMAVSGDVRSDHARRTDG